MAVYCRKPSSPGGLRTCRSRTESYVLRSSDFVSGFGVRIFYLVFVGNYGAHEYNPREPSFLALLHMHASPFKRFFLLKYVQSESHSFDHLHFFLQPIITRLSTCPSNV